MFVTFVHLRCGKIVKTRLAPFDVRFSKCPNIDYSLKKCRYAGHSICIRCCKKQKMPASSDCQYLLLFRCAVFNVTWKQPSTSTWLLTNPETKSTLATVLNLFLIMLADFYVSLAFSHIISPLKNNAPL